MPVCNSLRRTLLAALLPAVACLLQWFFWPAFKPFVWFLFYPAVFFSSRLGGLRGGLLATAVSIVLVIYVFIPPQFSFQVENPSNLYSVAAFMGMGLLFSLTHEGLRQAQEKIQVLYDQTRELDALKSQLFANVSHELRTPLTLILGPVARQLAKDNLPEETRRDLEVAERNARLLYRHVNDLLDVAKVEAGRMAMDYSREDLAGLVRFAASHFEVLAGEKQIRLAVEAPGLLPAEVDAAKFQRILFNLLSNAFKFTPQGGEVKVALRAEGPQAICEVCDTGPGIPEALREAVFERFRQLDGGPNREHGGTGLGLAIVQEFTRLHQGAAVAGAAPGGGARFTVALPLAAPAGTPIHSQADRLEHLIERQVVDELRPAAAAQTDSNAAAATAPLVLVVEDNPDMAAFLAQALGRRYRAAIARNGAEGLAQAMALKPDLIVSDIMMPVMTGDQLVRELRSRAETRELPVLMLTAKADDALRVAMLQEGVRDYIQKPFAEAELLAKVEGCLAERRRNVEILQESESNLRALLEAATESVFMMDLNGQVLALNSTLARRLGRRREELLGSNIYDFLPAGLAASRRAQVQQVIDTGQPASFEDVREGVHLEHSLCPILDGQGRVTRLAVFGRDITGRARLEAERQERYEQARQEAQIRADLLDEVNHRVKNNLVSILGIIQMERRQSLPAGHDPRAVLTSLEDRISGMVTVHEMLTKSHWQGLPMGELARRILAGAVAAASMPTTTGIAFEPAEAQQVLVSARQATVLALILNELATNSVKHAFAGRQPGHIQVVMAIAPVADGAMALTLTYRDNGAGWPAEVLAGQREGVGLKLIRGTLRSQPLGRLELASENGARTTIGFKLAPATDPAAGPSRIPDRAGAAGSP